MKYLPSNTNIIILLLVVFSMCSNSLKAQQPKATPPADTAVLSKMAKRLTVSRERARQLQWAFNFHNDEIEKLMQDKSLDPKLRQQQLKQLLDQRRMVIDATLDKTQKQQLKNSLPADTNIIQAQRQAMRQRHREQLDRTPHQESQLEPMQILKPAKQATTNQQ